MWISASIFSVLALVLLSGHGAWMIAGYNTATPEQKEEYDEKKLCRVTGGAVAVIAASFWVLFIWGDAFSGWEFLIPGLACIGSVVWLMVRGVKLCKKE